MKYAVKRRHERHRVDDMDVYAKTLFNEHVEFFDISATGACITTQKNLHFDTKYIIKFDENRMPFSLLCSVQWERLGVGVKSSRGEFIPVYRAGVVFKDVSTDKLIKLKDFMRISGIPNEIRLDDKYKTSALRFKIHSNERAVLYYPKTSAVKKISIGGMLIETDIAFPIGKKLPMALILSGGNLTIRFLGRVASCRETPEREIKHSDVGVEFLAMSDYDRSRLKTFIGSLREH